MIREIRIAALAIITIALVIWGYNFVKGKNLFKNIDTFHTVYPNVDQLTVAAPVLVNGYNIGSVSKISLNREDINTIKVSFEVEGDLGLPKNTRAVLMNDGLVGGKILSLEFDALCNENNCAKSGDYFEGVSRGLVESLVGVNNLENYSQSLKTTVGEVFDTLNARISDESNESPIPQTFQDLHYTMENLREITSTMNTLMKRSSSNLDQLISNLASITTNITDSNENINRMISNLEEVSLQLKDANVGTTIDKSNNAIDQTTEMITQLQSTLDTAQASFKMLNKVLTKMDDGDGSLSRLLNDPDLYSNLESTSNNLSLLLQDMRLNPRRYLSVSVFGKKAKKYELPEDDPALKNKNDQDH